MRSILILCMIFVMGCADLPDPPDINPINWTGNYLIGDQIVSLVEDENGNIDVAGYVYAQNPGDGTDGEFYLSISALKRIDGIVRYERVVQNIQLNQRLFNVKQDSGLDLAFETHYFTYTLYFVDGVLTIELVVRDSDFEIVVDRVITNQDDQ